VVNGFTIEDTSGPVMSADERFIVFARRDSVSSPSQIYRWDGTSGETILISVNREGAGPGNGISDTPWVSADGRHVTFLSHATDLVEGELDRSSKLYVRDVEMGTTQLLSVAPDGEPGVDDVVWPFVSTDAELAVFDVPDDRYVAGDVNRMFDVFALPFGDFTADLLSVGLPGTRSVTAFGPSLVEQGSLSVDGRYVAFVSQSDDLVSNDANGLSDVFVRDLVTGQTILVSVNQDGTGSGNGMSTAPRISADGRFVAFQSLASDLVDNDDNERSDVFVRDLLNASTTLVSVNRHGTGSATLGATEPVISADGRHVAFLSTSPDLVIPVPERNNVYVRDLELGETKLAGRDRPEWSTWTGCDQVVLAADGSFVLFRAMASWRQPLFRSDLETGITERVDQPMAGGTDPNSFYSMGASLSNDGRWVAFLSTHTALAPEAANGLRQVFLRDLETGSTQLITVSIHGSAGNGAATECVVSDEGRWVAFVSAAGNLVPNDPKRLPDGSAALSRFERDVFLRDVEQGRTMLVSRSGSRDQSGDGPSDQVSLSADARYVAYSSWASDLVAGDQIKQKDVFVFDRVTGLNRLWSVNDAGSGAGWGFSSRPVLSADGGVLVFKSFADDLIALDYNDAADVFWARVDGPGGLNSFFADIQATAGETVTVRWRGGDGLGYLVEYRDSLLAGEWVPLPAMVEVNDGWAWVVDVLPAGVKERYYRVTLTP
jgi:Tol biopolymer transport system component